MENDAFDSLTRAFMSTHPRRMTRRGMARLLGGLALGGPLALVGLAEVEAKCKKKCGPCKRCKQGKCKPKPAGTACAGGTCQGGSCVSAGAPSVPLPPLACGSGGPCRVFLSSTLHNGNLGGLTGADAICQGLADAEGLPGTYKAWLSDATSSPRARFVPSTGPYQLVDGTTIAANFTDLTDGTLTAPIGVTETGGGVGATDVFAWTGTLTDGSPSGIGHCANWSTNAAVSFGHAGNSAVTDSSWTDHGSGPCSALAHLYCFQQR